MARIDPATAKGGWDGHGSSFEARGGFVFVGGATFSNRVAVKWLLRAALPALAALSGGDGGCVKSRRAKLVLVGAAAWAEEAKKACMDARKQRKEALVDLLCDNSAQKKTLGKWEANGVVALGRVDDVAAVLRSAKIFVNPATVASGISTKVWLALEHGLPVLTTPDGTRGLPQKARENPPFLKLQGTSNLTKHKILTRDTAASFAKIGAEIYCDQSLWRKHALAALRVAKDLESRRPWSTGALADLFKTPPALRCHRNATTFDPQQDAISRDTLIDALETRFHDLLHRHSNSCIDLSRHGGWDYK